MKTNAWNITDRDDKAALRILRDKDTQQNEWDACYQICRFYRNQVFYRDLAEYGANLVRKGAS